MGDKIQDKLRKVLNHYDPVGLYFGNMNFDEYDPEIEVIFKNYKKYKDRDNFRKFVFSIFQKKFGKDLVNDENKYEELSNKLYQLLKNSG